MRSVIGSPRSALPDLIPRREKELVRLLRAARHARRHPGAGAKRGRPPRWRREELAGVAARLGEILGRETSAHISLHTFVVHYLRLLDFPPDVVEVLGSRSLNLFEAERLARVTARRLGGTADQAKRVRAELLSSHLRTKASGSRLRQRVNELLRAPAEPAGAGAEPDIEPEDLEGFDPYDSTHLFWEQLRQLGFAFREIKREDVIDEEIEELLKASELILNILSRIRRRKEGAAKRLKI